MRKKTTLSTITLIFLLFASSQGFDILSEPTLHQDNQFDEILYAGIFDDFKVSFFGSLENETLDLYHIKVKIDNLSTSESNEFTLNGTYTAGYTDEINSHFIKIQMRNTTYTYQTLLFDHIGNQYTMPSYRAFILDDNKIIGYYENNTDTQEIRVFETYDPISNITSNQMTLKHTKLRELAQFSEWSDISVSGLIGLVPIKTATGFIYANYESIELKKYDENQLLTPYLFFVYNPENPSISYTELVGEENICQLTEERMSCATYPVKHAVDVYTRSTSVDENGKLTAEIIHQGQLYSFDLLFTHNLYYGMASPYKVDNKLLFLITNYSGVTVEILEYAFVVINLDNRNIVKSNIGEYQLPPDQYFVTRSFNHDFSQLILTIRNQNREITLVKIDTDISSLLSQADSSLPGGSREKIDNSSTPETPIENTALLSIQPIDVLVSLILMVTIVRKVKLVKNYL